MTKAPAPNLTIRNRLPISRMAAVAIIIGERP
jgi:hypothetical protein